MIKLNERVGGFDALREMMEQNALMMQQIMKQTNDRLDKAQVENAKHFNQLINAQHDKGVDKEVESWEERVRGEESDEDKTVTGTSVRVRGGRKRDSPQVARSRSRSPRDDRDEPSSHEERREI